MSFIQSCSATSTDHRQVGRSMVLLFQDLVSLQSHARAKVGPPKQFCKVSGGTPVNKVQIGLFNPQRTLLEHPSIHPSPIPSTNHRGWLPFK